MEEENPTARRFFVHLLACLKLGLRELKLAFS